MQADGVFLPSLDYWDWKPSSTSCSLSLFHLTASNFHSWNASTQLNDSLSKTFLNLKIQNNFDRVWGVQENIVLSTSGWWTTFWHRDNWHRHERKLVVLQDGKTLTQDANTRRPQTQSRDMCIDLPDNTSPHSLQNNYAIDSLSNYMKKLLSLIFTALLETCRMQDLRS